MPPGDFVCSSTLAHGRTLPICVYGARGTGRRDCTVRCEPVEHGTH